MNNRSDWERMKDIKVPDELKERTLAAAREARRAAQQDTPQHLAPAPRRRFGMAKRILAAACAFAVVVGGTAVWKSQRSGQPAADAVAETVAHSFGIVAYAADTGETIEPRDSKIVFEAGSKFFMGVSREDTGFFSDCLFRVTGENIQTISATIDKAGLYRFCSFPIEEEEVNNLFDGKDIRAQDADELMVGSPDGKQLYAEACWKVENGFVDQYAPDISYGLLGEPREITKEDSDMQAEWHARIDEFDGATLTVTVTFTDGTQQTQTLTLHTGKLGCEYVDGEYGPQLTGEVLTDEQAETQGYVYGVYAEIQS